MNLHFNISGRPGLWVAACAAILLLTACAATIYPPASQPATAGAPPARTLAMFDPASSACYDRTRLPATAVVDAHLHFRPFGGVPIPFETMIGILQRSGVLFANMYGIGQSLPIDSGCEYYLDCVGQPALPSLKNDFANAQSLLDHPQQGLVLTLSMTFPDLAKPDKILQQMQLLDREYPGMFHWMGEVNLVKQALFGNAHVATPIETIADWAPFMATLRERNIPLAIHSDLGSDVEPMHYLPLMLEVLHRYPDNRIIWMHMGLSKELQTLDADTHIGIISTQLDRYPNLMVDISWRVLYDNYFSKPAARGKYVAFLNRYADRVLPGTDFVALWRKNEQIYKEELRVTSDILRDVDDNAFRKIALGENYFRLLNMKYKAPAICARPR